MASVWRRFIFRPITGFRVWRLKKQVLDTATDKFIELLLMIMDLSFYLFKDDDYQNHLKDSEGRDFKGRYFFRSADEEETIAASAIFENADMKVGFEAIDDWDVMVTFENGEALRNYIFSEKQDIFDSISKNAVEVDGNLNHIFKFGFMVQDLPRRLGIE